MKLNSLKLGLVFVLSLFLIGLGSSAVVTNSQDWADVQAGMQLADEQGEVPYFARTADGSAVLSDLPVGVNVTVVQSTQNNYLPNLDSQIRTRDYNYNETIDFDQSTELVPEDVENFVVISRDRPSDVIVASPLANSIDGWVLVVSEDKLDEVEGELEGADEVIKVGQFKRDLDNSLDQYVTESIDGDNRFDLSAQIAERISEEREVNSVKLSDGRFLESSIFTDSTPVLLTAQNGLSSEVENYLIENTGVNGVVAIGAEMGTVGRDVESAMEEAGRESLSVFVKYGQATTSGSRQVDALSLFPLPQPNMQLRITAAQYVVDDGKLLATLQNPSDTEGFALNSIVVKDGEENTVGSVGDDEPQFIPADSTEVFSYDIEMDEATALSGTAEFTTQFGTNSDNLDRFVDNRADDVYGPPRILDISTINLEDNSEVNVTSVKYDPETAEFNVTVQNSDTGAYARANLRNVVQDGLQTTLSTNVERLDVNETASFLIDANLSQEDLQETENVNVELRFGERESFLINTDSVEARLEVLREQAEGLVDSPIVLVLIVVVLLILLLLVYELTRSRDES